MGWMEESKGGKNWDNCNSTIKYLMKKGKYTIDGLNKCDWLDVLVKA